MAARELNEKRLRSSFTKEEYDQFLHFFQTVWKSDATYKVFMSTRAFNLNFTFLDSLEASCKDGYKTENMISHTGLLLCAEEIAESYQITGEFPRILLIDDLLINGCGVGCGVMKLIFRLENLILEFLKESRIDEGAKTIHNKLMYKINIYVFAQSREILLDSRFHFKAMTCMAPDKLKSLSQKISRALQRCEVANTSDTLSAELPVCFYQTGRKVGNDPHLLFRYRGNQLRFFYRNHKNKILETVRVFYKDNLPKSTCTSLVLLGNIPYEKDGSGAFHALCSEVAEEIRQIIPSSRIAEILDYPQQELVGPKAQMLSYLLSVFSYTSFLRMNFSSKFPSLYQSLLRSNYQKVAANFGHSAKIGLEFMQLFVCISKSGEWSTRIFQRLECCTGKLCVKWKLDPENRNVPDSSWQPGRNLLQTHPPSRALPEFAENIFCEMEMNMQYRINQYTQTQTSCDPAKPDSDSICLEQYLQIMERHGANGLSSIGYALHLMDNGLFEINLERSCSQDAVHCILKAEELSTFVLPRRFSVLIPAFSIVEREAEKKGISPKMAVSQFVDYLEDHCYQEGEIRKEDAELLCKLKRSRFSLLYLYAVGQKFQDWNIDLLTTEDYLSYGIDEHGSFNLEKYVSRMANHAKQVRYYNCCARVFLL